MSVATTEGKLDETVQRFLYYFFFYQTIHSQAADWYLYDVHSCTCSRCHYSLDEDVVTD